MAASNSLASCVAFGALWVASKTPSTPSKVQENACSPQNPTAGYWLTPQHPHEFRSLEFERAGLLEE